MEGEFRGYIPSPLHRFEISADPISQKRYEFVKSLGSELRPFPFYRGLTLKGSLSKGKVLTDKNAASTDINLGCFLDFDEAINFPDDILAKLCKKNKVDITPDLKPVETDEGKWNVFASAGLTPTQLAKIRLVQRLVRQLIKKQGEAFFKTSHKSANVKPSGIWPEIAVYSLHGKFSLYSTLSEYETANDKNMETRIAVIRALSLPFGMLIDGDLSPYLQAFFDELKRLDPAIAEKKWQEVRRAIFDNERPGLVTTQIENEYPGTLNEAIEMYVVGNPNSAV